MEPIDPLEDLEKIRNEELAKLVALASDQAAAQSIIHRIHSLEKAISKFPKADSVTDRYTKHNSAIDAILVYLDEVGHPVPAEQIVKALCEGGWRRDSGGADAMLRRSLSTFVSGRNSNPKQIKKINSLLGRDEWPESLFYSAHRPISPTTDSKYTRCKTAADAIVTYLTDLGRPALPLEIANAISESGWRGGGAAARMKVLQSIGQLRNGRKGAATGRVRFVKDLVGLGEWEEPML